MGTYDLTVYLFDSNIVYLSVVAIVGIIALKVILKLLGAIPGF